MDLFPLTANVSIIEGKPFLYLNNQSALVLGDVHVGHESIILGDDINQVTPFTKKLRKDLSDTISSLSIKHVIFNGDIKHLSYGVTKQERTELKFLLEELSSVCNVILIKGNHDRFLKFALTNDIRSMVEIMNHIEFNDTLVCHGDRDLTLKSEWKTIILSHEHPSFVFKGSVGEQIKLQAFVLFKGLLDAMDRDFVILPAVSALAGGVPFPPRHRHEFLSPMLKRLESKISVSIYPFDEMTGVIPLPNVMVE